MQIYSIFKRTVVGENAPDVFLNFWKLWKIQKEFLQKSGISLI